MQHIFFKSFIFLFFSSTILQAEQLTDSFRLDGYGNINMTQTNERRDRLTFSGGFQGRYQFTDRMSVTGQIDLREGRDSNNRMSNSLENYDSDLKWFYFDYYLKDDITLRIGAFQFPVFKSSETGRIGYTYTWTETPFRFYGVFGCDDFEGVEVLKNFSYKDFDFLAQVSYGKSNNELSDGRGESREGDVDNLVGLTLKTTHNDFILNIGYLQAKSTMDTSNQFVPIDSNVNFNMFALESEIYLDDYTLKSGIIKTNLSNIFPESLNYYTSLEYTYSDFTPYILYSRETLEFKKDPPGPFPRKETQKQYREKYSLGLRYDYNANIALKVSYSHEVDVTKYNDFDDNRNSNDTFIGSINVIF